MEIARLICLSCLSAAAPTTVYASPSVSDRLVGLVVKASASGVIELGSIPDFGVDLYLSRVLPGT